MLLHVVFYSYNLLSVVVLVLYLESLRVVVVVEDVVVVVVVVFVVPVCV